MTETKITPKLEVQATVVDRGYLNGPSDALEAKSLYKETDLDGKPVNEIIIYKCVNSYLVMAVDTKKKMRVAKKSYKPSSTEEKVQEKAQALKVAVDADSAYHTNNYDFFYKWVDEGKLKYHWSRSMRRTYKKNLQHARSDDTIKRAEELKRKGITYNELERRVIEKRNSVVVNEVPVEPIDTTTLEASISESSTKEEA